MLHLLNVKLAFYFTMFEEENWVLPGYTLVPMPRDGSCQFHSLSFCLYGNTSRSQEVRRKIVNHVVKNWKEFQVFTIMPNGAIYPNPTEYHKDMSSPYTFGTSCELLAAAQIYNVRIEVYREKRLFAAFGNRSLPVSILKFTGDLENGHYDAMVPVNGEPDNESISTDIRRNEQVSRNSRNASKSYPRIKKTSNSSKSESNCLQTSTRQEGRLES